MLSQFVVGSYTQELDALLSVASIELNCRSYGGQPIRLNHRVVREIRG